MDGSPSQFNMSNYTTSTTPSHSASSSSFIPTNLNFTDPSSGIVPTNSSSTTLGLLSRLLRGSSYTLVFLFFILALLTALMYLLGLFYRQASILQAINSDADVPEDSVIPQDSVPDDLQEHVLPDHRVYWCFDGARIELSYSTTSESSTAYTAHGNGFYLVQFYF